MTFPSTTRLGSVGIRALFTFDADKPAQTREQPLAPGDKSHNAFACTSSTTQHQEEIMKGSGSINVACGPFVLDELCYPFTWHCAEQAAVTFV